MTARSHHPRRDVAELADSLSARRLFSRAQRILVTSGLGILLGSISLHVITGFGPAPLLWAQSAVAVATAIFVLVIAFRSTLMLAALRAPIPSRTEDECDLVDERLPAYTVLVPLHREESVLPGLIHNLSMLDYPVDRLRILLLVESDDRITGPALESLELGAPFEIVPVPEGGPRTKPNACNHGLAQADGEFCVIYDAEDRPDPDQLRKAVTALREHPDQVVCVQAGLAYWNPWTNWLTRAFAAEYALNFALTLRGLDRLGLPIPLGGTSNHFRIAALRELGGWDPYNVTEDADLGVRIARRGWRVRMLDSITMEEANSDVANWIRQRSRWIKGHLQTWLVHMRRPWRLLTELGWRGFTGFQLTFALSSLITLINPVFWALAGWYLVDGPDRITQLYPPTVLYLGAATMLVGNLVAIYHFIIACMVRNLHRAIPLMPLIPMYWMLMSVAAYRALAQLLRPSRRHYWELTRHGLVIEQEQEPEKPPSVEHDRHAPEPSRPSGTRAASPEYS